MTKYESIERVPFVAWTNERKENNICDCRSSTKIAAVLLLAVTGAAALVCASRAAAAARGAARAAQRARCVSSVGRANVN